MLPAFFFGKMGIEGGMDMRWSIKIASLGCAALMMLTMAGCGSQGGGKTVYFAAHDDAVDFTGMLYERVNHKAQELGVPVEYLNSKGDSNLQIDQLNEAIDKGAAAIVLLAVDGSAAIPAVERANAAGIPVISTNRDLNGGKFAQVMSDEKQAGRLQGEYMAKHLPQGAKVVYLMGESSLSGAVLRWEGFKEACLDKRPDIQLLVKEDCGWSEANSFRTVSLWLKIFPQIDGVISGNDGMALGALRALKAAGREKGVLISGVDAMEPAVKAVAAGEMSQTVKQDADKTGEEIGKLLQEAVSGKVPTEDIKVPFTEITQENAAQFR